MPFLACNLNSNLPKLLISYASNLSALNLLLKNKNLDINSKSLDLIEKKDELNRFKFLKLDNFLPNVGLPILPNYLLDENSQLGYDKILNQVEKYSYASSNSLFFNLTLYKSYNFINISILI